MSGVTSSKRQWTSLRVRAVAAVLLALAMLIPMVGVVMAQDGSMAAPPAQWGPYAGANKMCIVGRVINFDETGLPYSDLYTYTGDEPATKFVITAVQLNSNAAALTAEPNKEGNFEFQGLTPGDWRISIALTPGWQSVEPYTDFVDVHIGYGSQDCTRIRFKLRWPVPVEVLKIDDNHKPLKDWTIRAAPAYGNWFASPVEEKTNDQGMAYFNLTPGKWVFTEKAPKGTHFTPVLPQDGKQELIVNPKDNVKYSLRFKNRIYNNGCISVNKFDDMPRPDAEAKGGVAADGSTDAAAMSAYGYGLPGWKITIKRPNGTIAASGVTDALGNIKFKGLPYGPYIVVEETRIGWEPTEATAKQVVLTPETSSGDSCVDVTFVNRQRPAGYCIEGYKIDYNEHIGIPNWVITATVVTKGGFPDPNLDFDAMGQPIKALTTTTDATGKYVFEFPTNDYRIPGSAYKVCEENLDGWLPHTATCQTVYLPWKPSACVRARDFVNQQVGHWESITHGGGSSSGSGCSSTHTVVAGESLFGIGNAYGVSGGAMLAANPWVNNRPNRYVFPGDSVCIP